MTVNPDAGMYEITSDRDLLTACERAIDVTYAAHPYYPALYADRGRRLSSSDSGCLVHFAGEGREHAQEQIAWLSRVLAARGMPTVLLEHHLAILAEEVARLGNYPDVVDVLTVVSQQMRAARVAVLGAETTDRLEADFDAATRDEPGRVEHIGLLVVAAVADEVRGLPRAESSLMAWVADVERFSAAWVEAAKMAAQQARAAARPVS